LKLQCRILLQRHVRWISYLPGFMGQDSPLCIIPTNRRFVFFSALAAPSDTRLVSLQQMVLFGQNPSQGTLLKASQFLAGALATVI